MPNEFNTFHALALAEVTDFLGETFLYKGAIYKGVISELELQNELVEGGLLNRLATVIVVLKSLLPSEPKSGDIIYIGTRKARIQSVKADEVSYELQCETGVK